MTTNFGRRVEAAEADAVSAKEFLQQRLDARDRRSIRPLVETFFAVLNKLKADLFKFNW
jgi:hypothetical protein